MLACSGEIWPVGYYPHSLKSAEHLRELQHWQLYYLGARAQPQVQQKDPVVESWKQTAGEQKINSVLLPPVNSAVDAGEAFCTASGLSGRKATLLVLAVYNLAEIGRKLKDLHNPGCCC